LAISCLPGTTIEADLEHPERALEIFTPLFEVGGLILSQAAGLTGLPAYQVQNWVKRGFVSHPVNKHYTLRQFARIVIINALKDTMQIEKIVSLLNHLGGTIEDCELYSLFVKVSAAAVGDGGYDEVALERELQSIAKRHCPDMAPRLVSVLRVMVMAHAAARVLRDIEREIVEIV
jgi:DNA-binding transcriptional MerR regulator